MKILNFGSLNIDHVYRVERFVRPGETIGCDSYRQFSGGKGANQSIALAFAGANVFHAGKIGPDGTWLEQRLARCGVDTRFIETIEGASGHAMIQVNREGENAIIIHGGANRRLNNDDVERILPQFSAGDYLLLQNEVSANECVIRCAAELGMYTVFNPAPMSRQVMELPLELIRCFILNRIEATELTGESRPETILSSMRSRYPNAATVLTLGPQGARYRDSTGELNIPAAKVEPVDTTAAGDTFVGYFLAGMMIQQGAEEALKTACRAAAVCVTSPGAADSIPKRVEL